MVLMAKGRSSASATPSACETLPGRSSARTQIDEESMEELLHVSRFRPIPAQTRLTAEGGIEDATGFPYHRTETGRPDDGAHPSRNRRGQFPPGRALYPDLRLGQPGLYRYAPRDLLSAG